MTINLNAKTMTVNGTTMPAGATKKDAANRIKAALGL